MKSIHYVYEGPLFLNRRIADRRKPYSVLVLIVTRLCVEAVGGTDELFQLLGLTPSGTDTLEQCSMAFWKLTHCPSSYIHKFCGHVPL